MDSQRVTLVVQRWQWLIFSTFDPVKMQSVTLLAACELVVLG